MLGNPTGDVDAERAVVAEVIARADPLTRDELTDLVRERFAEHRTAAALGSLLAAGVVIAEGETVAPSPALTHLDELGMIAV